MINLEPLVTQTGSGVRIKSKTPMAPTNGCVNFFTANDGMGAQLTLCEHDHNWKKYTNLGSIGDQIHSHHYAVKSYQCGSGVSKITFLNGNTNPWTEREATCQHNKIYNANAWVTSNGTGVGVYKPKVVEWDILE